MCCCLVAGIGIGRVTGGEVELAEGVVGIRDDPLHFVSDRALLLLLRSIGSDALKTPNPIEYHDHSKNGMTQADRMDKHGTMVCVLQYSGTFPSPHKVLPSVSVSLYL